MNYNDDFIIQLEDYLETFDGETPLPDRVRDAIRAELPSARQVQPRTGLMRVFTMMSNASVGARAGLAATAVVAVVVLGAAFYNNSGNNQAVGGVAPTATAAATPTPTPTVSPSAGPSAAPSAAASPSVVAGPTMLNVGTTVACDSNDTTKMCLAPGTYQLTGAPGVWPATVTIDLPAGWFEVQYGDLGLAGSGWDAVLVQGGPPDYNGSGWGVMFSTIGEVYRDPCDGSKGRIPAAQVDTPQKLAAALAAWPKFTVTTPHAITVDGHAGLELTLARTTGTGCDVATAWLSASGTPVDTYPFTSGPKYRTTVRIVDTGRGLLVIRASDYLDTSPAELGNGVAASATRHTADMPRLQAILDSIRITSNPGS